MIDQFDKLVNEILKKDVNIGDDIENINPDCEHYGTKGKIKKIIKRPEVGSDKVSNNHNIPGSDVEYEVTNDTENAKKGDRLRKSLDQIKKD